MPTVDDRYIITKADRRAVEEGCYFDPSGPQLVRDFARAYCSIPETGKPFQFLPWFDRDVLSPYWGWKRPDGSRRFRRGSVWTPKKVGKTSSLAVLLLYQLFEEAAAQCYVVSSAIESASHIFRTAADMIEASPALSQLLWYREQIRTIAYKPERSFAKILSGKKVAKSGHNISACYFDELCEVKDPEPWHRLYYGGKARKQPVWLSISTPQYDRYSLAGEEWEKAQAILSGKDDDPEYLAVIHGVPDEVDPYQPENWWPYLEKLGPEVVNRADYLAEWARVKENPRKVARFFNYQLCRRVEALDCWLPEAKIKASALDIDEKTLYGKKCYVGIDGAKSNLAAYTLFFPEEQQLLVRFFIPEDTAKKSDEKLGTQYQAWAKAGHCTLVPGNLFDWDIFRAAIKADEKLFQFKTAHFDPEGLDGRMSELQKQLKAKCFGVLPYKKYVSNPIDRFESMVMQEELKVQSNPIMLWNMRSARIKPDPHDRMSFDRDVGGRYDGVAAAVLSLFGYLQDTPVETVYKQRGIITL
jgi:phage terminase large subunit-like protein